MMEIANKLKEIIKVLETKSNTNFPEVDKIRQIAEKVGRAWSGSWLGYHSKVYYTNFETPPPSAHFSIEWGLHRSIGGESTDSDWKIYQTEEIIKHIYQEGGDPDLTKEIEESDKTRILFESSKVQGMSLLTASNFTASDPFAEQIYDELSNLNLMDEHDYVKFLRPTSQIITRDMKATEGGLVPPAHIQVEARLFTISSPFIMCGNLAELIKKCLIHINNKKQLKTTYNLVGKKIFIGHGKNLLWRELKDFLCDKLKLDYEEFNRIPIAGYTNIARLSEMLNNAKFAFLVMTAEDEKKDGNIQARMNVVHEAGLFQGRLGFEKSIILLEEGCEEFSNIHGLGQIRFPKAKISAIFEDVREVLTREAIIPPST